MNKYIHTYMYIITCVGQFAQFSSPGPWSKEMNVSPRHVQIFVYIAIVCVTRKVKKPVTL